MQTNKNEDKSGMNPSASPRTSHKSSLFGLLSKRSSKIEPETSIEQQSDDLNQSRPSSSHEEPLPSSSKQANNQARQPSSSLSSPYHQANNIHFAKCSTEVSRNSKAKLSSASFSEQSKSHTLPANNVINSSKHPSLLPHNLEKSHSSSGLISGLPRKFKSRKSKNQEKALLSTDGSQSDGGLQVLSSDINEIRDIDGTKVKLRKSPHKYRSPNHNRFSHQFSLCCKAEKKPVTPPVTVRYNSIPDANNVLALKRDNLSLSWSTATTDNNSLSNDTDSSLVKMTTSDINPSSLIPNIVKPVLECVSAPESPVTSKTMIFPLQASPTNSSVKSGQSLDAANNRNSSYGAAGSSATINTSGPIHPIAVSACRSRLRLKLYPPGKELPPLDPLKAETPGEAMKRATTPQHNSSPNIATQVDDFPGLSGHFTSDADNSIDDHNDQYNVRFMSHENIQLQRQLSNSGLARQALMAAQMLSLIPTEKARERSFLDGHLGPSSLLGPTELVRVLPNKEVTIFVGTWNMNGQSPPKQMNDFVLPANVEHVPDIVAIGTQESSPDRFEWEVTIQETLGPSHVLFHSTTLGTLHLAIYMRRDLIWYCSAPEDASMSVRTGSAFRTKGAVAISFCLFGTSMLFVTSHLTAHQQKVKERVSDVKRIIHALDLPKNLNLRHKSKDVTQNFDNVFWCGDLNFRLGEPREKLLEWIQNTKFPLPSHLPHGYMHTDQLSSVLSDGAAFRGFMEANITFPPTYKYDPGTQHFDTSSKQRAPAYTDRILYKYRQSQGLVLRRQSTVTGSPNPNQPYVTCLLYDSVPSITTSDHKPVWALFKTLIRAGSDSIPLAAGLFSRDIYLEGMRRRLNNQYTGSSAVCSLQ